MAQYAAVPCSTPSTKVELRISCKNLRDADVFSKSDPLVAVYAHSKRKGHPWEEFARTELIKNSLNPDFAEAIPMNYNFEEQQRLRFVVYDLDNETVTLDDDDDVLGSIECNLGEIVSAATFTKPLQYKGKSSGTITIRAEEVCKNQSLYRLKFTGHGLDKKDFLGKSDPYLEFAKQNTDGSFTVVYRTQVIKKTLNPDWPTFEISSNQLSQGNPDVNLKVTCYDWDADGSHDLIGAFTTSLAEINGAHQSARKLEWPLINPSKKAKKKKYTNSGTIHLESVTVTKLYTFLDYIMGGCQINFTVAIDFTGSNGHPSKVSSLHYIDPFKPNEYTQALISVGEICENYDSDKLFPALGFGAKISGVVSHEFALNGNPQNPFCQGIPGVVAAYHQALQCVELWGPTNMAPVINHVKHFSEDAVKENQQSYFILLVLTDGDITDMEETKRAIIEASTLPMSIIVVGVGGASFEKMVELDADDQKLRSGRMVAERDIVQFVPFRQFAQAGPAALASAVLAEVPDQLTEYMKKRNITPLQPQTPYP